MVWEGGVVVVRGVVFGQVFFLGGCWVFYSFVRDILLFELWRQQV